ncbi:MAG: extracellular solute-binding protein, partial [Sulfolobales archaeon]
MVSNFKALYVVVMIIAVVIAAGLGFVAGQMMTPTPTTRESVTITQRVTQIQTVTVTVQPAPQPTQPTQEQLLAPIIDAARKEGKLVIYSSLDRPSAEPLLNAFKAKYPFIDVQYIELGTVTIYNRYISERAAGAPTADILWSSGFDLQYLLVLNGSAQPYRLTIYDKLPEYAKYKDLAYVPGYLLAAPIYNAEKIPKDLAPRSLGDLLKLLTQRKDLFPPRGIAAFNVEASAFGLVFTYYQYKAEPELIRDLVSAAGSIGVVLQSSTGPQIEMVKTGQVLVSLSLAANYAFKEAKTDPRVGVFVPSDLAVLVPRVIFITKEAKNPNA